MEQRFNDNRLDLETLREFCLREGEAVVYRKGDQLEREGDPASLICSTCGTSPRSCVPLVASVPKGPSARTSIPTPSARYAATSRFKPKKVAIQWAEMTK